MLVSYLRTIILYLSLITVIRLMGKRQIGEMEPAEFVVTMLLADLASVPMQDAGIPLLSGLIPILTVLSAELLLSTLAFRSIFVRKLFCGKPVILIENGKILYRNLQKTRVTVNELVEHLREHGTVDLSSVQFAILETNGQISALLYPKYQPASAKDASVKTDPLELPVSVICDGVWQEENLKLSGRSKGWLEERLAAYHCTPKNALLFTVTPSGRLYLSKKEEAAE